MTLNITRRAALALATGASTLALTRSIGFAQDKPIRIGAIYGLTGPVAQLQQLMLKGTQIAVNQANAAGGVNGQKIELVVRDDKFSGTGSVEAFRELAGDGINLFVAGSQTITALPLLPLLKDSNALVISPAASAMSLTHENFNHNFFCAGININMNITGLARVVVEQNPNITNWICVAPDGAYGKDAVQGFTLAAAKYAKQLNNKTVSFGDPIFVDPTSADYKVALNNVMNSPAEGLFSALVGSSAVNFLQQGALVGLNKKIKVVADDGNEAFLAKALGKNLPPNYWSMSYWVATPQTEAQYPLTKKLAEDYVAMTNDHNPPAGVLQLGWRAAMGIFAGIKAARSTETEAVIKALEETTFESAMGPYAFRKEDHQGLGTIYYSKLAVTDHDPGFAFEKVISVKESDLVSPPTPGVKFQY